MGTIVDKLNKLKETKQAIKEAILSKGVADVSDVFSTYPDKIRSISSNDGSTAEIPWHPNKDWYDIEYIINDPKNQIQEYPNMCVLLYDDTYNTINISKSKNINKFVTSDGKTYIGETMTHTWSNSSDKPCYYDNILLYNTRYIICYSNNTINIFPHGELYIVSKGNCNYTIFDQNHTDFELNSLIGVKHIGNTPATIWGYHTLMYYKNFKRAINCNFARFDGYFGWDAGSIEYLDFQNYPLEQWPQLNKSYAMLIMKNVNVSNLKNIPDLKFYNIRCLELNGLNCNININKCPLISHESLIYIINNAKQVSSNTMNFGQTNLDKLTDEEKNIAINKGWNLV